MNTPTPSAHSGEQGKPSVATGAGDPICGALSMFATYIRTGDVWDEVAQQAFDRAMTIRTRELDAKPVSPYPCGLASFRNFHRSLCERFGYAHDEVYWWRDQVSLEEHIAKQVAPPPSERAFRVGVDVSSSGVHVVVMRDEAGILTVIYSELHPLPPSEHECPNCISPWKCNGPHIGGETPSDQAGISCGTCEGTGLANVVDQDDGALVIDDCPECGGESASPRGVGSGEVLPAIDVFRVAGGDTECSPNPSAQQAMECLEDLRRCYDEAWADSHPAPEAQAEGEPVLYAPSDWEMELRIDGDVVVGRPSEFVVPLYLRPQPSASETPSADARDAERYRYLRRANAWKADYIHNVGGISAVFVGDGCIGRATDTEKLDSAIDAAIAAQRKEGE